MIRWKMQAGPVDAVGLDDRPGAGFTKIRLRASIAGEMRRNTLQESAFGLHSHYAPLRRVKLMMACCEDLNLGGVAAIS